MKDVMGRRFVGPPQPPSVWTLLSKQGQAMALKGVAADMRELSQPTLDNLQFRLSEFGLKVSVA